MRTADACDLYLRLKKHFTDPKFDYFKSSDIALNLKDYAESPSKFSLDRLARHPDPRDYLVYNFVSYGDITLVELMKGGKYDIAYLNRKKIVDSITYTTTRAVSDNSLNPLLNTYPDMLLEAYLSKKIPLEVFLILAKMYRVYDRFIERGHTNPHHADTLKILRYLERKYLPFINYNEEKIKREINATTNAA